MLLTILHTLCYNMYDQQEYLYLTILQNIFPVCWVHYTVSANCLTECVIELLHPSTIYLALHNISSENILYFKIATFMTLVICWFCLCNYTHFEDHTIVSKNIALKSEKIHASYRIQILKIDLIKLPISEFYKLEIWSLYIVKFQQLYGQQDWLIIR